MAKRHPNLNAKVFAIPLGSMFVMVALTLAVAFFNNQSQDTRSRAADVYPSVTPFFYTNSFNSNYSSLLEMS